MNKEESGKLCSTEVPASLRDPAVGFFPRRKTPAGKNRRAGNEKQRPLPLQSF